MYFAMRSYIASVRPSGTYSDGWRPRRPAAPSVGRTRSADGRISASAERAEGSDPLLISTRTDVEENDNLLESIAGLLGRETTVA